MMKNKNLTFVSNRYFRQVSTFGDDRCVRDLLTSTEFYCYFRGVATFWGSLLWEVYGTTFH